MLWIAFRKCSLAKAYAVFIQCVCFIAQSTKLSKLMLNWIPGIIKNRNLNKAIRTLKSRTLALFCKSQLLLLRSSPAVFRPSPVSKGDSTGWKTESVIPFWPDTDLASLAATPVTKTFQWWRPLYFTPLDPGMKTLQR